MWHHLNKKGAHRYCNEGKDSKFMANLIPSQNQERDINRVESQ